MNKSTAPIFALPISDEFKNKLHETKAWASSHNAKQIQAHLICLTENLLLLLRYSLEIHENIRDEAGIKRRQQRLTKAVTEVAKNGGKVPPPLLMLQPLTQTSVKFIRWVALALLPSPVGSSHDAFTHFLCLFMTSNLGNRCFCATGKKPEKLGPVQRV
jgi:hypothetical protein